MDMSKLFPPSRFVHALIGLLRSTYHRVKPKYLRRGELKRALASQSEKKIIIGSGKTSYRGWLPTNKEILDLLVESDWLACLKPDSLDAILAEHVWEHLTFEQAAAASARCSRYLKPGGHMRIAVPDGFHPDPDYIAQVKPGGCGAGADDHKVLYDYRTLSSLLEKAGYKVRLLEWFDEQGKFHHEDWDVADGFIMRSTRFDQRNGQSPTTYTSLIIDAIKPR